MDAESSSGPSRQHYFAYGSNMSWKQMQARCPGARFVGAACLHGHRLDFTRTSSKWACGVADVVAASDSETWGGVFEVTAQDIVALDEAEGHPFAYQRRSVVVVARDGTRIDAWAYVVVEKASPVLPSRAYWEAIVSGAQDCGLPPEYVSILRALRHLD